MTILGFTPVHSKPPSSEWGSGGIRSGPRLDWLQGVEEKSNSESRCFESDFLERKFYLPLSGVRKLLSPHLVERHGNWLTSRPRWPSIGSSLWCPRAGLGLVYLLPVLHPGPAGWKNGPTPFFLCRLDIPLCLSQEGLNDHWPSSETQ